MHMSKPSDPFETLGFLEKTKEKVIIILVYLVPHASLLIQILYMHKINFRLFHHLLSLVKVLSCIVLW